jgi:hypothetical protein
VVTRRRACAVALLALVVCARPASAQSLRIAVAGDAIGLRAGDWTFLTAETLARLEEGRTVRAELTAAILPGPGRSPSATVRRVFALSYDLWEERFAVVAAGPRPASISHLTAPAAAAWCVEQLSLPVASVAAGERFWIRLQSRILDGDGAADSDETAGLTLQRLIDVFSRRRGHEPAVRTLDGGPFRLPQ